MTEQEIRQIVKDEISKQHLAVGELSISNHTHNRVDSKAINSYDINTANPQGFVFGTTSADFAHIFYDPITNELSIQENASVSNMGFSISNFDHVEIDAVGGAGFAVTQWLQSNTSILSTVDDNTDTTTAELAIDGFNWTSTGNFAIQLPDTTRPAPVAGMIAFDTGQFYYCTVTGVWTPF